MDTYVRIVRGFSYWSVTLVATCVLIAGENPGAASFGIIAR